MFEAAELGRTMSRKAFDARLPGLRAELLQSHFDLRGRDFPVLVIVSGAEGAGKGGLVHRLNEWLDPRGVETHAFWESSEEERERPPYWRFWRALPGRGRIGILFGSWYTQPIIQRVFKQTQQSELDAALERIARFEQMLCDDGALIVKLWLHLPKKAQHQALKKLDRAGRATAIDRRYFKLYDRFRKVSERAIRRTDSGPAPWHVIEATDRRYREFTVGAILRDAIQARLRASTTGKLARTGSSGGTEAASDAPQSGQVASILAHVDLTQRLSEARYRKALIAEQNRLNQLAWAAHEQKRSMVMVFEGWDAAGKGSAIRRVTWAMDPRLHRVVGVAAPTDEERAQHYLWRFWRHLPRAGFCTLFDRSWYGRVLVERVEGLTAAAAWNRAYLEINEFEEQLAGHGIVINKFWLHISKDEQLRRFKERQRIAYKRHKITSEDWRNRRRWPAYEEAVNEMIARCSTEYAPWTIVAGNDKKFARIQILKTINARLEKVL